MFISAASFYHFYQKTAMPYVGLHHLLQ